MGRTRKKEGNYRAESDDESIVAVLRFLRVLNEGCRVVHNVAMNDPEPIDPRRRIRELNAIPERDRTDEQWDELNELEIRTAPGNRESNGQQEKRQNSQNSPGQSRRPDRGPKNNNPRPDSRPQEGRPADGRPPKRQHRRPKRPAETPGNS